MVHATLIFVVAAMLCSSVLAQDGNCSRTLDLIFVVDGSNSVGYMNFDHAKAGLNSSVISLTMGTGNTRVGLVTYGTNLGQTVGLTDNKQSLISAINSLELPDTGTGTDQAINWASAELTSRARDGVPRVIVVLTDGQSSFPNLTLLAAQSARSAGHTIYAIGIGSLTSMTELKNIVDNNNDRLFLLENFTALNDRLKNITIIVCTDVTLECNRGVDLLFVLDGSSSVLNVNYQKMLSGVVNASRAFWTSFPGARIGVLTYATFLGQEVQLSTVSQISAFSSRVLNLNYPDTGTATDLAITRATDILQANRRGAIPCVIVVITDGRSDVPDKTAMAANNAKSLGITLFAIVR